MMCRHRIRVRTILRFSLLLLLLVFRPVGGETLRIDVAELVSALDASASVDGQLDVAPIEALVLSTLQQQLALAELQFDQGGLIYQRSYLDREVEGGCNNTTVREMQVEIRILQDSAVLFDITSLSEPVSVQLQLQAELAADGRARQEFGIRLGDCQPLASDSFDFNASGQIRGELGVELSLNPQALSNDAIRFTPQLRVTGELASENIRVQVEDSVLRNLLEDFLESEIRDALAPAAIAAQLESLEESLQARLVDSNSATIDLQLPDPDDTQIASLYRLLAGQSRLPLTLDYLRENRLALLVAMLIGDQQTITSILTDAAGCSLAQTLQTDLSRQALFAQSNGQCVAIDPVSSELPMYSDADCQLPVDFFPSDFADYCELVLSAASLGNAAVNTGQLGRWTVSAGNTLDISARPMAGLQQPYVQRLRYKSVATDAGVCDLEMRVYSPHPAVTERRAVLAFHGGSWQYRPTGFVGLEVMATHLTNAGYVVFAPFYRLLGDRDGPAACRNVQLDDVIVDGSDALDWVLDNSGGYGATGIPVVFGQSAGAHLAASLAVYRPDDIARAALLYGPVDFGDFIANLQNGSNESSEALGIIEAVAGAPLESLNAETPLVVANSLPAVVAAASQTTPPLFLLHGEMDELVPFSQSSRLCNALSGNPANGPAPFSFNLTGQRRIFGCDEKGSTLHLIAQGDHALDICIAQGICASGDRASAELTADSIGAMLDWMAPADQLVPVLDDATGGNGGGVFNLWIFWLLIASRFGLSVQSPIPARAMRSIARP